VDINRIDDAVQTVVAEFARIAAEPIEADELEKARNFAKGRLVLSLEDPKGMIMFGLRNEVLESNLREPDEVLAGLDAVTIEDVQRVAQDIIREDRLNFALIGPFDDPERFQKLLALSA
jgi:predicted Zn-dependent peptidase